jgi:hypothetical protein
MKSSKEICCAVVLESVQSTWPGERLRVKERTNMTKYEATEWVYDQDERRGVDPDDLYGAFYALYGREPDADDERAGLWSLCCAATPNCGTRPA